MAIYHLSMKVISRGNGQNAVASAAYRSGEELTDEQDGSVKFYDRSVLPETHILAPEKSPEWVFDRQKLWNNVERSETRINSRLARELEIALPIELSNDQQTKLINEFIQTNCVDRGMIADIAIHRDHRENPHAHVMLTTREITSQGFGEKNRSWNQKEYLEHTRKAWAEVCNKHLENANSLERIDHRSYKDQGVDLIPTEHVGVKGYRDLREGKENDTINRNRVVEAYNQKVISLQEKRDQLLNEGLTEKTNDPSDLVVTYRMYMTNQRELRIAYNKLNYYGDKLKKDKTLSLFEREQYAKAQKKVKEIGSRKFDYLENVNKFLSGESSIYVKFAKDFGEAQAEKLRKNLQSSGKEISNSMQKYIDRTATRYSEEMSIRFADQIRQLGTSDIKTIIPQVEKQLYTDSAKRIVKGWVSHESVTKKLVTLNEELEKHRDNGTRGSDKKSISIIKEISVLENVKQFYETQALAELRSKGFHELVDKYNTPKHQSVIVSMYEELVRHPDKISSSVGLETRVFNNFKLRKVQDIVRGELSGVNIQKRLDSLDQWRNIQERSIAKLSNGEVSEAVQQKITEKSEQLVQTKQSIQLLREGQHILAARTSDYLKQHPDIKDSLENIQLSVRHKLHDPMSMDFKKEANYHLFTDSNSTLNKQELIMKMYDNIMDFKEYDVEKNSKEILYRHEYSSYRAIMGNLDEARRQTEKLSEGLEQAQDRVQRHKEILDQFEEKWTTKKDLEGSKLAIGKGNKLREIDQWLSDNEITARTKSGALNQLKYQYNQAVYQVTKYDELSKAKIPALENMKVITENKAVRTVEKDFKLQAGFQYRIPMTDDKKELFVYYAEAKKELGVEHLDTQKFESKLSQFTEQHKQAANELKSTQEMIQEKQTNLDRFEKSVNGRLSRFEESLGNQSDKNFSKTKEQIDGLRTFKKEEVKRMESQIKELKEQEKAQRDKASQKAQAVGIARSFKDVLNSYKSQVSEAEMNLARKNRLKSLEKDQGLELELERKK